MYPFIYLDFDFFDENWLFLSGGGGEALRKGVFKQVTILYSFTQGFSGRGIRICPRFLRIMNLIFHFRKGYHNTRYFDADLILFLSEKSSSQFSKTENGFGFLDPENLRWNFIKYRYFPLILWRNDIEKALICCSIINAWCWTKNLAKNWY
jgi:hypothetical protein